MRAVPHALLSRVLA
ncbi:hypothetical protein VTO73DRAFT_8903 [Trametes versicolor]